MLVIYHIFALEIPFYLIFLSYFLLFFNLFLSLLFYIIIIIMFLLYCEKPNLIWQFSHKESRWNIAKRVQEIGRIWMQTRRIWLVWIWSRQWASDIFWCIFFLLYFIRFFFIFVSYFFINFYFIVVSFWPIFKILEFTEMSKVMTGVDPAMLQRCYDWILSRKDG